MFPKLLYRHLHRHFYSYLVFLAIATLWKVTTFSNFVADANAQTFEPPVNNPAPTTTIGGGRRGSDGQCLKDLKDLDLHQKDFKANSSVEYQITPLLPPNQFGLTISSNPRFFAYIPKTNAIAVEFTLENPQGKGLARKRIDLTTTPSVVNVQFDGLSLEIGKDYKWLVSLVCETGDPEDHFAEGIIRRIQPESSMLAKLEKATAIDRVYIYAKFGIWYEAIANLANLRLSQPNNAELRSNWLNLLTSSNLAPLANSPLKN
ncbi:DUF928 domain-containing protein [Pseudanabaena sp. 'Roaring Creek']|uniref:DUF928 domain-containing protein n=1 Tax=Pseudanabaena sp. 'Roaring Creek' TaxID=1681830 RepID=UPI0006D78CDA|nr:DUF928 domain-containing protein [Pseudanabaena sp. 'Roaring Creek']